MVPTTPVRRLATPSARGAGHTLGYELPVKKLTVDDVKKQLAR
jgi:hypothetical protein